MAHVYVRPSGVPTGADDGTSWDDAFDGLTSTIIGNLSAGDTLYICGDHNAFLDCPVGNGTVNNHVIIDGDPSTADDLDAHSDKGSINYTGGSSAGRIRSGAEYYTIKNISVDTTIGGSSCFTCITPNGGITFDNVKINSGAYGIGWTVGATHSLDPIKILNCEISNTTAQPIWIRPVANAGQINPVYIENCHLHDCASSYTIRINSIADTYSNAYFDGVYIRNNRIHDNTGGITVELGSDPKAEDADTTRPRHVYIEGNNIYDNGRFAFSINAAMYDPDNGIGRSIMRNNYCKNNSDAAASGSMENLSSDGLLVEYNYFIDGHTDTTADGCGMWMDGSFSVASPDNPMLATDAIYRYNYVEGHVDWDNSVWTNVPGDGENPPSSGVRVLNSQGCEIYGNVFKNNNTGLALTYLPQPDPDIHPKNVKVFNNTFIDCNNAGIYFKATDSMLTNEIKNNIFVNTDNVTGTTYGVFGTESAVDYLLENNIFYGYTHLYGHVDTGVITTDGGEYTFNNSGIVDMNPLLDRVYKLSKFSPAINSGTASLSNNDYYGVQRSVGYDIGATWYTEEEETLSGEYDTDGNLIWPDGISTEVVYVGSNIDYIEATTNGNIWRKTMGYTGSNIDTITVTNGTQSWEKTFTYDSGDNSVLTETEWVIQ